VWRTWLESRIALHMMIITRNENRMSVPRWSSDVYRELYQERHGVADDDDAKTVA